MGINLLDCIRHMAGVERCCQSEKYPETILREFEEVLRRPQAEENAELRLKYKACVASCFAAANEVQAEALYSRCDALSQFLFSRETLLPALVDSRGGSLSFSEKTLSKQIKATKKFHKQKQDLEKQDQKKSDKDQKEKEKKDKKEGKKDKKDKKDKKEKKDKNDKKEKKDKKEQKVKDKSDQQVEVPEDLKEISDIDLKDILSVSTQYEKFGMITQYLGESDRSISHFLPCLKLSQACVNGASSDCETLERAAEFQLRSEDCWRSFLSQVHHCRYDDNPEECLKGYQNLELECSIFGLEAERLKKQVLA